MRLRRLVTVAAMACCLLAGGWPAAASDQVIFLVRHAEKSATPAGQPSGKTMMADDPPLSAQGQERAARLAAVLASAGVKHVFTTEFLRTRQTAAPLAEKLKVRAVMSASKDPAPLVRQVRQLAGNILIVGHSNTLPELLKRLGVREAVAIGENEYDNLFVLVRRQTGEPTLIRLRY